MVFFVVLVSVDVVLLAAADDDATCEDSVLDLVLVFVEVEESLVLVEDLVEVGEADALAEWPPEPADELESEVVVDFVDVLVFVDLVDVSVSVLVDVAVFVDFEDVSPEVVVVVVPVLVAVEPVAVTPTALRELPSVSKASK